MLDKPEPRVLPEKLWRCDCGGEVLGVSFYTWGESPPDWFIEIYRLPGVSTFGWRARQAMNLLLGRTVYFDSISLDKGKVEELVAFLSESIDEVNADAE